MSKREMHPSMVRDNSNLDLLTFDEIFKVYASGYKFTAKFRRLLWRDSGKVCAYCGCEIETHIDMHIDHFISRANNGTDDTSNLVCSCSNCNLIKRHNSIEDFRFNYAVSVSVLKGVVQPSIVKKIMSLGIDMPVYEKPFYFELLIGGKDV